MVEVQEGDEIPLTLTEIFSNGPVLTNNLIHILNTGLGTNTEALETGVLQDFVDTVDGGLGIGIVLVKRRNLCGQFTDLFLELLASLSDFSYVLIKLSILIQIALYFSSKHEGKILHDFRLTLRLAGTLCRNHIVVCFDAFVYVIDQGTDIQKECIRVLQRDRFGRFLYLLSNTLTIDLKIALQ